MPRRKVVAQRKILPEPKFSDVKLAKFINVVMRSGKKSIAENIVYSALDLIEEKLKKPPLEVFEQALDNVSPLVEVKSRRVGGATYQVPVEVRASRRMALSMRWLVNAAKTRSEKKMSLRLAGELIDAYSQKGSAIKKREDVHRMAESNKAFSHFRW